MKLTPEQINAMIQQATKRRMGDMAPAEALLRANVGDAFELASFARAIARTETQSLISTQAQAARRYARLLPVNNTVSAAMGTALVLQQTDAVGMGRPYSGTGNDIPLVDTTYSEVTLKVKAGVVAYQYSIPEIAAAARAGVALQSDKVDAAVLGFERHMHKVAFSGEPETGLFGLFNQPNVDIIAASTGWATATPDEILEDIANAVGIAQDDAELNGDMGNMPNTILIPSALFRVLNTRRLSDHSDTTLLSFIRDNNLLTASGIPNVAIEALPELNTAGPGGNARVVIYRRDPGAIEMLIPQELQFLAPQPSGLDIYVPGHYLYAGIWLKRRKSLVYVDGV